MMTQNNALDPNIHFHYSSTRNALVRMYLDEGWRSGFKGLAPALLGVSHVIIQFPLYEHVKSMYTGIRILI